MCRRPPAPKSGPGRTPVRHASPLLTGKINIGFEPFIALFAHHFFFLLTPSVCRFLQTVSRKNARLLSKPFFVSLSPSLFFGFHTLRPGVVPGTRNVGVFRRDGPRAWADSNGFAHKGLVSLRNTTLAARPQSISEGWMTMGAKRTSPFQPHHKRWPFKRKRYRRASTCIPHLSESDRCGFKLTRSGAHVLVCFKGNWESIGAKEKRDLCHEHANRSRKYC